VKKRREGNERKKKSREGGISISPLGKNKAEAVTTQGGKGSDKRLLLGRGWEKEEKKRDQIYLNSNKVGKRAGIAMNKKERTGRDKLE